MKPKPKQKTKGYYVKQLDKFFSIYIRQSYSNDFGMSSCYTCSAVKHYKDLQCGHFISRAHMNTRWDESNVRPQCVACNVFNKGRMDVYAMRLVKECGAGELERLNALKNTIRQWTIQELKTKILFYKDKIK